ncbi:unnamed protein product, partial [Mesorhabditis belari]|uniref:C2H2-type domain-containing protein n=1 Tax=Mesorhabditis belari TaxID=2138241 RepID=A0AAF3FA28_9BILA
MENLKLHQPAPPASNHIRHEALEAQYSFTNLEAQDPPSTRAKTVSVPCLHCGSCLKKTWSVHLLQHIITHASTRRFRCSKCDTTNHTLAELKRHHIKCRGETIDAIDSKMIEEWR